MNSRFLTIIMICGAASLSFGRPETIWSDDAEHGTSKWVQANTSAEAAMQGEKGFVLRKGNRMFSKEIFPLNPEKRYTVSCDVKAPGAKGNILLGLTCLDKSGREISSASVHFYEGSETKLAKSAFLGDKEIYVVDGSQWKVFQWACIAFDVDSSGQRKDIPNSLLSTFGITAVEKTGDGWKISLAKPIKKDYPAGTPVREHRLFTNRNFVCILPKMPAEWKKMKGSCQGIAAKGNPRSGQWWPGTVSFRVFVMANIDGENPVFMDNFKLEVE